MGQPTKQELIERIEILQTSLDEAHRVLANALGYDEEEDVEDDDEGEDEAEDD